MTSVPRPRLALSVAFTVAAGLAGCGGDPITDPITDVKSGVCTGGPADHDPTGVARWWWLAEWGEPGAQLDEACRSWGGRKMVITVDALADSRPEPPLRFETSCEAGHLRLLLPSENVFHGYGAVDGEPVDVGNVLTQDVHCTRDVYRLFSPK
jgi:hypothetical protein